MFFIGSDPGQESETGCCFRRRSSLVIGGDPGQAQELLRVCTGGEPAAEPVEEEEEQVGPADQRRGGRFRDVGSQGQILRDCFIIGQSVWLGNFGTRRKNEIISVFRTRPGPKCFSCWERSSSGREIAANHDRLTGRRSFMMR